MKSLFTDVVTGAAIPNFFYGTAWKEERTAELTEQALRAGFRAIDTANQRKHYFEEAVGEGLQKFLISTQTPREEIFLQTKFTYQRGQDHRLPYDPKASLAQQVEQSFASSLKHLQVKSIDSFILHGPYSQEAFGPEDKEVWRAMESLQSKGLIKFLGISNLSCSHLKELYQFASVKPRFAQIRTYANQVWQQDTRKFCKQNNIFYQGFSLLTANRQELQSSLLLKLAEKYNRDVSQIVFRFAKQIGMIPLTGTTSQSHMISDLNTDDFELSPAEIEQIEMITAT
jgi:diketogulonate reductase-like aldo/keto reductase